MGVAAENTQYLASLQYGLQWQTSPHYVISKYVCRVCVFIIIMWHFTQHRLNKGNFKTNSSKEMPAVRTAMKMFRGGGGIQQSFIRGGSAQRFNSSPFYTTFLTEKVPFHIPTYLDLFQLL